MSAKSGPLSVGVVGIGAIAREKHLPNWRELEAEGRVTVKGLCDIIPTRAEAETTGFEQAAVYEQYKEMFAENAFDIVDVCTQNRLHAPITIAALRAGAHVLVEKPMAMTVRECSQMIAAAQAKERKLMVAQHMRFMALNQKLKKVVDSGELGDIYTGNATWLRRRGIPGWGVFHQKAESLGGPLIDLGVHVIDLCHWFMGSPRPVAVSGMVYRKFGDRPDLFNAEWGVPYKRSTFDVEDFGVALVRFENGASMQVSASWAANIPDERIEVSVLGDKAGISTTPPGVFGADDDALTARSFDWLDEKSGHREEIRHFVSCVEEDKEVLVRPEESLQVQKIIEAIYKSSERKREVSIR